MGLCRVWIAGNPELSELEAQFINTFSQVQVICPWTITLNRCNGSLQFRVIWKAKNARVEGLHLALWGFSLAQRGESSMALFQGRILSSRA